MSSKKPKSVRGIVLPPAIQRDIQRFARESDRVYADALSEFDHLWPDSATSPGGKPPVVAFLGKPEARENKDTEMADISIPLYCRNSSKPVDLALIFQKDNRPIEAAGQEFRDKDGHLAFHDKVQCPEKDEANPTEIHLPATAVSDHDRSTKAIVFVGNEGQVIAGSTPFDVHFPKQKKKHN